MTTIKRILGDRLLIRRLSASVNGAIIAPDDREAPFEALVVGVGADLSEAIKPGDKVLCAAHPSQDRVGTRYVVWNGAQAELMSTLDVVGILL